jgi:hypothetical protein
MVCAGHNARFTLPRRRSAKFRRVKMSLGRALRRFPVRRRAIEELALKDPSFRTLCVDFGDAEAVLERWGQAPSTFGEARLAEYKELTESLAAEITMALDLSQRDRVK